MNIEILYEDNHLLIVNKKPGELVQSDISGVESLQEKLKLYLKEKYSKQGNVFLGIVHRLDKPVSGITIFARTSKSASRLHEQFLTRAIIKKYIALVKKSSVKPGWNELKHGIGTDDGFVRIREFGSEGTKPAILKYKEIDSNDEYSLLGVDLLTGRKHQIRAQLSKTGMPVIGDSDYGSDEKTEDGSIFLHAFYLKFTHPVKKTDIELAAEYPDRFNNLMQSKKEKILIMIRDKK